MAAGSIIIDLLMKTGAFETDTKRAEKRLREFKKEAEQIGRVMATAFAAGTAALTALTVTSVKAAGDVTRLSQAADMGAQEFQRYAAGASALGIEQDKLGDIFRDTQDKVGDFLTTGAGPLADFFETIGPKVGVTAEQFRGLSGAQGLELYVSSLEAANVTQAEMVFFMEAIASDATMLLPLLRNNAEGFRAFGEAAEDAGAIMNDDFLRASSELQTATWLLEQRLTGVRNAVVGPLLPTLVDLGGALTDVSIETSIAEDISGVFAGTLKTVAATALGAVGAVQLMGKALGGIAAVVDAADFNLIETMNPVAALVKIVRGTDDIQNAFEAAMSDLDRTAQDYGAALNAIWEAGAEGAEGGAQTQIERLAALTRAMEESRAAAQRAARDATTIASTVPEVEEIPFRSVLPTAAEMDLSWIEELEDGFDQAGRYVDRTRTTVERLEAEIADVQELAAAGFFAAGMDEEVLGRLNARLEEAKGGAIEAADDISEFMRSATERTQGLIADSLRNGFDDGARGIADRFTQLISDLVAEAIAADLGKRLFGDEGVGSGGGWLGQAAGFFGSVFGGGRATGGPVAPGVTYRINELEPEFFRPNVGGQVVPLSRMAHAPAGGGVNVQQTINVQGRVDQRTASQIQIEASRRQRSATARLG